ncbi:hypothetical protein C7H19_22245 [Aphanothece hegewaldii CCALA 016]|uniref:REase associating with pPIWI RE domain-containing protein n=1 Tax=Aphanothece hegewaldii CCALA 016 TaxID=2107694 RepID=A0A2T1LRU4_9CHRO|nr:hypothetical protein C7H19_22245 [Aphanothece hegewaldii CCALA 016]
MSGQGWRADVLAIKGDLKIAFEIQWSRQSIEETQLRQERYRQSGVECVWLFRTTPDSSPNPELPIFQLVETGGEFKVKFESRYLLLEDFVKAWLNEQIQYCTHLQLSAYQKINICISSCFCAKCEEKNHYFQILNSIYLSECGLSLERNQSKRTKLEFRPEIVQLIQKFAERQQKEDLYLANIERSKERFQSFTCCWCGYTLYHRDEVYRITTLEEIVKFNSPIESDPYPHWCYSKVHRFCNQRTLPDESQQSIVWVEGRKTDYRLKHVTFPPLPEVSTTIIDLADLPLSIKKSNNSTSLNTSNTCRFPDEIASDLKLIWQSILGSLPQEYEGLFRCYASLKSFYGDTVIIDLSYSFKSKTLDTYMSTFLNTCQEVLAKKSLYIRVDLKDSPQILWQSVNSTGKLSQDDSQAHQMTQNLNDIWQQLLKIIPDNYNSLRTLLMQHGLLLDIQNYRVIIGLSSQPLIDRANRDKLQIKQSFEKILGQSIEVQFTLLQKIDNNSKT